MAAFPERLVGERIELVRHRGDLAEQAAEAIEESLDDLRPWQPWVEKYRGVESRIQYSTWVAPQWGSRFDFQILRRSDGRFLGQANLEGFRHRDASIQIGYWLRSSELGKGYATAASKLLLEFGFDVLGVDRVALVCHAANRRSLAVARRIGMKIVGVSGSNLLWSAARADTLSTVDSISKGVGAETP